MPGKKTAAEIAAQELADQLLASGLSPRERARARPDRLPAQPLDAAASRDLAWPGRAMASVTRSA